MARIPEALLGWVPAEEFGGSCWLGIVHAVVVRAGSAVLGDTADGALYCLSTRGLETC